MLRRRRKERKKKVVHMAHYIQPKPDIAIEGHRWYPSPGIAIATGSFRMLSLCGTAGLKTYYSQVYTAEQFRQVPLTDDERMCKLCERHLKYPLLVLGAL